MKQCFLMLVWSVLVCSYCFADNEKIMYKQSDGTLIDPFNLPKLVPCTSVTFALQYTVPSGYTGLCKIEWYDQAFTPIATTSTNEVTFTLKPNQVLACTVYYYINVPCANNTTRSVGGVTIQTKTVGFTTPSANPSVIPAGCQNGINFSSAFTNASNDNFVPAAGTYSVNWNLPSGWSNSPQSLSTTAIPDASGNGGSASVTVTLNGCSNHPAFTSPVYNISRAFPAPAWGVDFPGLICSGTSNRFNLNGGMCGASSYTYTISGSTGATFAANGSQSLTTTDTYADLSFASNIPAQTNITLSAVANYPGGSSTATSKSFLYGLVPWTGQVQGVDWDVCPGSSQELYVDPTQGGPYVDYQWTVISEPVNGWYNLDDGGQGWAVTGYFYFPGTYYLQVTLNTPCGPLYAYGSVNVVDCGRKALKPETTLPNTQELIYPNPAQNVATINLPKIIDPAKNKGSVNIQIVSLNGTVVQKIQTSASSALRLNTASLPSGTYIVRIIDGQQVTNHKLVVAH